MYKYVIITKRIPVIKQFVSIYQKLRYKLYGSEVTFTKIYRNNQWGGVESVSGPGSDLIQTKVVRRELPILLKDLKISTILDIPCGDFNWMHHVNLSNIRYVGGDIVKDLIQQNRVKYEEENILFRHLDLTKDDLPKVDLIICRDCLQHLSYNDTISALKNICRSKSTYLLTTTYTAHQNNQDIVTGYMHPLNLVEPPFSLPDPIKVINEESTDQNGLADKSLGLWRIEDISSVM